MEVKVSLDPLTFHEFSLFFLNPAKTLNAKFIEIQCQMGHFVKCNKKGRSFIINPTLVFVAASYLLGVGFF